MAIINSNFNVNAGYPIDSRYMNGATPWTSVNQANIAISTSYRYIGLTVNILGAEYWYKDSLADGGLIIKSTAGTVTGADNGLSLSGTVVKLGGTLTGVTTITRGLGNTAGIEYGGDYSADFTPESLVTKRYVDTFAIGAHPVAAARVASTGNIDLTTGGLLTIDLISLSGDDRVLVKDQADLTENGIYDVAAGAWTRSGDFNTSGETLQGSLIPVITGSTQKNTLWTLVTKDANPDVTDMIFTLFSSPVYIAGNGIDIAGTTISIDAQTLAVINAAITGGTNGIGVSGRNVCLGGSIGSTTLTAASAGEGLTICSQDGTCCNRTNLCDGVFSSNSVDSTVGKCTDINNGDTVVLKSQTFPVASCYNEIVIDPQGICVTLYGDATNSGLKYAADYSTKFDACLRAIPDTGWIKNYVSLSAGTISGTVNHIPAFNSGGNGIEDTDLTFSGTTLCNSADLTVLTNSQLHLRGNSGLDICGGIGGIKLCGLPSAVQTCVVYIDPSGNLSTGISSGGTGSGTVTSTYIYTITGNSSSTSFNVNHGFGYQFVDVEVICGISPYQTVYPAISRPNGNCVTVDFNTAPTIYESYKVLISNSGGTSGSGTMGGITGATNGICQYNTKNICLGGNISSPVVFTDIQGSPTGLQYYGDYSSTFGTYSLVDKNYVDFRDQKITKKITQAHTFVVGDVIGWRAGVYDKAIADGTYDGEILGIVSKVIDSSNFELTQSGYVDVLSGLVQNKTYFLSDTIAGQIIATEPVIVGHISKAVLIANSATSGWVLPYAGYVISTGGEGGGTNTKQITQVAHGFLAGDAIGWSGGTYNKAIANGEYNGEVIGLVSKRVSTDIFDLTQAGYVSGITGLTTNTTYFLSDSQAGKLITAKPTVLGHVVRAMFITDTSSSGWVLPYPGYLLTTGSTSSGTSVGAGIGISNDSSVFNLKITDTTTLGGYVIPVKIDSVGTRDYLFIDSVDITGGTGGGTLTGATNIGSGVGIYSSTVNKNLEFNSLVGSGNTTITQSGDNIIIHTSGSTGGNTVGIVNVGSNYLATTASDFIGVTGGTAVCITLPANPKAGQRITVADICGDALADNITICGNGRTIADISSEIALINTNYGSMSFVNNNTGTSWSAVAWIN